MSESEEEDDTPLQIADGNEEAAPVERARGHPRRGRSVKPLGKSSQKRTRTRRHVWMD